MRQGGGGKQRGDRGKEQRVKGAERIEIKK